MSHSDTTSDKGPNTIKLTGQFQPKLNLIFEILLYWFYCFHVLDPSKSSDSGSQMHIRVYAESIQVTNAIGHDEQDLISDLHNDG